MLKNRKEFSSFGGPGCKTGDKMVGFIVYVDVIYLGFRTAFDLLLCDTDKKLTLYSISKAHLKWIKC